MAAKAPPAAGSLAKLPVSDFVEQLNANYGLGLSESQVQVRGQRLSKRALQEGSVRACVQASEPTEQNVQRAEGRSGANQNKTPRFFLFCFRATVIGESSCGPMVSVRGRVGER